MQNPFTAHPHSVGETYLEHAKAASGCGFRMVFAGLACIIHSVIPFIFIRTASQAILELHAQFAKRLQEHRD